MAFVLSAELKISGVKGFDKIEKQINKLSNVTLKISPKLDARQLKSDLKDLGPFYIDVIPRLRKDLKNTTITKTVNVVEQYSAAKPVKRPDLSSIKKELDAIDKSFKTAHSTIHGATESIEDFGTRSAIALKRFLAFGIGTSVIIGFGAAFKTAIQGATEFEKEIAKVAQVTQISLKGISDIRNEITALSSGLGVSSQELAVSAATLAQTGVGLDKVRQSLKAIALARLSPSFGSDKETVEGLIAVFSQFGPAAGDAFGILSKINSVSKAYAVESQDLITAVQKSGGAFKQAGGSFEQFLGTITAIRSTTRESADAIATGVRTIISRLQRPKTLDFIEDVLGINLRDPLDSKKTLPIFDVIDKIRTAIKEQNLLSKEGEGPNIKLSQITEEIGGTRQLSRVIPLLNNFEKAVAASNLAIDSADSLTLDAAIAQETLANRVQKTTEEIKRFGDTLLQDDGFQLFVKGLLTTVNAIARVGSSLAPLIPLFGTLAGITAARVGPGFFAGIGKAGVQRFNTVRQSGLAGGGEYFGGAKVHGHTTRNFGGRDTVPALLKPGEVVLNESQQRRIGGVAGLGRNEFFGALGVPGFAGGGLNFSGGIPGFANGGIRGGLFGPKVAARARREAKSGNLYAYDSGQEGYYQVNPDGKLNFGNFVNEQELPVGAKTISHHPYSDEYDAPHIKGSNLLKIRDPKINKLDELGLSTIAPSFELDPELRRLQGLGSLNAKSLLRSSQAKFGKNTLIKTAFGSDLQGLGVFGRPKGGLSTGDAEEIIRRFESGSDSGFFAQKKLPGPYFNELRVHVAVDQNGKVKILGGGTVNKGTLLDPTNKKSIERLVNSGIDEDKAGKVASSFKKAAQVSAFKTIRELVVQKGITNATFGVDVGATRLDDAREAGINTQEFYSGVETKTGTIVFETNPSEASGSSGFFGGFATQDLVKKVFGQKTKKLPAKDKEKILELMAPRMQGPLPLFGPDRSLAPVIPETINPDEIQSILGVNPDLRKIFQESVAQPNIAAGIAEPKPLLNFAQSPILNIIGRFLNNKPKSLESEQNRVFEKIAGRSYGDVRRLIGREGGGESYPFDINESILPAMSAGMKRLYRGESKVKKDLPSWIKNSAAYKAKQVAQGRWFTHDPQVAAFYMNEAGYDEKGLPLGKIGYTDVPEDVYNKSKLSQYGYNNAGENPLAHTADIDNEFFVPSQYSKLSGTVPTKLRNIRVPKKGFADGGYINFNRKDYDKYSILNDDIGGEAQVRFDDVDKIASVIMMSSVPRGKKFGPEEGKYKRRGFLKSLLNYFNKSGHNETHMGIQSQDTMRAMSRLTEKGMVEPVLETKSGLSDDPYYTNYKLKKFNTGGFVSGSGTGDIRRLIGRANGGPARKIADLPKLGDKHVRVIHLGPPDLEDIIKSTGLDYSKQGDLSATARAFGNADDAIFSSEDPRFKNSSAYVFDILQDEYRNHINITKAPGLVHPSKLTGIINRFASGGYVSGAGKGDKIPSILEPGEVVLNQSQQRKLGGIVGTSPRKLFRSIGVPFQDRSGHYAGGVDLGSGSGSVASNKAGFGLLGLGVLANAFGDLQGPLKDVADLVTQFAGTTLILNETLAQTPNMLKYNAQLQEVNQEFENSSQKLGAYANEIDKNNKTIAESSDKRKTAEIKLVESQKELAKIGKERSDIASNKNPMSFADRDKANKELDKRERLEKSRTGKALAEFQGSSPALVAAKEKNKLLKQEAQLVDDVNQKARENQEIIAGQIKAEERKNKAIQIGIIAAQLGSTIIKKASQGQLEKKKDSYALSSAAASALSFGATGATLGSSLGPVGIAAGAGIGAIAGGVSGYFGGKQDVREARSLNVQNTIDAALSGQDISGDKMAEFNKDIENLSKDSKNVSGSFSRLSDFTEGLGAAFSANTAADYSITKGMKNVFDTVVDYGSSFGSALNDLIPYNYIISSAFDSMVSSIGSFSSGIIDLIPYGNDVKDAFAGFIKDIGLLAGTDSPRSKENTSLARKKEAILLTGAKSVSTKEEAEKYLANKTDDIKSIAKLRGNADIDQIRESIIKKLINPLENIGATVSKNKDKIFASLEEMNNFLAGIDEAFNQTQKYSDAIAATTGGIKVSDRSSTLKNTSNITNGREFDRQLQAATGNFGAFGGQVKTKVEAAANNAPALRGFISDLKSGNLGLKDQASAQDVLETFEKQFKDKFNGAEDLYAQAVNSLTQIIGSEEDGSKIIDRADIDLKSATQAMDSIGESVGQIAATMSKAVLDAQNQYGDALKAAGELYQQGRAKRFEGFDVAAQKVEFQGQFGRTNINSLQNIENNRLGFFAQGNPQQLGGQLRASQDRFEQIQVRKEQGVGQAEGDALIKAQTQELDNIARINKQFDLLEDTTSRLNITQLKLNKAQQEQGVRKSIADIENFGSFSEQQKLAGTKQNIEDIASGKIKISNLTGTDAKDAIDLLREGGQGDVNKVLPGLKLGNIGNVASDKLADEFARQYDVQRRISEGQTQQQAFAGANNTYGTPLDQQQLLIEGNNIIQQGQDVKAIRGGNIQDQATKQAQIAGVQYDELFKSFANGIPQLMAGMDNAGQNFGKAADIQLAAANQMKNVAEMMEKNVLGNGEIDLAGKVDLNVNINGGQVLAELTPQINEIVQAKIKESLNDFISKKLPNLGRMNS